MYSAQDVALEITPCSEGRLRTQQDIFSFIIHFYEINTTSPTLVEICQGLATIQNTSIRKPLVYHHLKQLVKKGKIKLVAGQNWRSPARIVVNHSSWKFHGYRQVETKGLP